MLRILAQSVRGGSYLIGNPSVHPIDGTAPADVGTTFATMAEVKRYVVRELAEVSSYHAVTVIDPQGEKVARGWRAGRGGTGKRWAWEE